MFKRLFRNLFLFKFAVFIMRPDSINWVNIKYYSKLLLM